MLTITIRSSMVAAAIMVAGWAGPDFVRASEPALVKDVRVTVLSTNLAEVHGRGEWGWSALVEADGYCLLFDTGNHPDTVLDNARALGVDLGCVREVILSHHHADHTGGLRRLHEALSADGGTAFSTVHVARGLFHSRPRADGSEGNAMIATRAALEQAGVTFRVYETHTEIRDGIWVTGPVDRRHAEKTYPPGRQVVIDGNTVEDVIPESQGLAIATAEGFVVVLGCGHAGVVNTLDHVRARIAQRPIAAVMGGFHLFAADTPTLDWVGGQLARIAPKRVMGAHCTGIEPLYHLRRATAMSRADAIIGSVGAVYDNRAGFSPGPLAR